MLERVLRTQARVRTDGPDAEVELISEAELHEIRRIWRVERQDWDDSVPEIFRRVNGYDLDWPADDDGRFGADDKELLDSICRDHGVPFDLVAKMLEEERRAQGMARRAGIQKALESVLTQEWRSEEEILSDNAQAAV